RTLPGVRDVSIAAPGKLTLHLAVGSHYVDLNNLLANVRAEPGTAIEKIADFFAATTPVPGTVQNGDVMFRVMRATAPVTLEAEVEGKRHEITLASMAVGPDLSAVFVRDSPRNIAYL